MISLTPGHSKFSQYSPETLRNWGMMYMIMNMVMMMMILTMILPSSGRYCWIAGLNDPMKVPGTGECEAGFYCESGATTATPGGIPTTSAATTTTATTAVTTTTTPACSDNNGPCPPGHFCLQGGVGDRYPTPCPIGTYRSKYAIHLPKDCPQTPKLASDPSSWPSDPSS